MTKWSATVAMVMTVGWLVPVSVAGQAQTSASDRRSVQRTSDSTPDIQGVWSFATITPLERPNEVGDSERFTEEEAAARDEDARTRNDRAPRAASTGTYNSFWWDRGDTLPDRRTSLIVDPPDGKLPPLTPAGQTREDALSARGFASWKDRSLWERCVQRGGVPRLPSGYNNNLQILQTDDYVVILYEMIHESRIIPLDGRPHVSDAIRQYQGDARARWEDDTLVVETTNFTNQTHLTFSGVHHSEGLHVVERFTRTDADELFYEFTIDDPSTWTRSWTATLPMPKSDGRIYEYACHEGNYGMANLLSGARAEEEEAAVGAEQTGLR